MGRNSWAGNNAGMMSGTSSARYPVDGRARCIRLIGRPLIGQIGQAVVDEGAVDAKTRLWARCPVDGVDMTDGQGRVLDVKSCECIGCCSACCRDGVPCDALCSTLRGILWGGMRLCFKMIVDSFSVIK